MPKRRSARLRAAARDSHATAPPAKRQRRQLPLANGGNARSPLHELTNATTPRTRTNRNIHTNNESRCVIKEGELTESAPQRSSKRILRSTPTPIVHQPTIANQQRVRKHERRLRRPRRHNLSEYKENEIDSSPVLRKDKDLNKSEVQGAGSRASQTPGDQRRTSAIMKANNSEKTLSSLKHKSPLPPVGSSKPSLATGKRLKRIPRPPSPPPLYPEDEIQPKPSPQSKPVDGKHHRNPITPVLYPEDEIQRRPPRRENEQNSSKDHKQFPLPRSPPTRARALRTASAAALAKQAPSNSRPSSHRPPSRQKSQVSPGALQGQSLGEKPIDERPETSVTPQESQNLQPERGKQGPLNPSSAIQPRRLSLSPEMPALPRPPTASVPPVPLHTYSKRRHAVQDLALPSRKSLGVRSRASSGDSTGSDSKREQVEALLGDAESEIEDSEGSASEAESEKVDSALRSFIGQQRKMWDEIDNIELEEDFD